MPFSEDCLHAFYETELDSVFQPIDDCLEGTGFSSLPDFAPFLQIDCAGVACEPALRKKAKTVETDCFLSTEANSASKRFLAFMTPKNIGRKKDDLLLGLIRLMTKLAVICKKADLSSFDEVFSRLVTDHRILDKSQCGRARGKYLPVRASAETRPQFFSLFQHYLTLYPTQSQRTHFCRSLLKLAPKRQFTNKSQRTLFVCKQARMLFYYTVIFLDFSPTELPGCALARALNVAGNSQRFLQHLVYDYMNSLGHAPFDGLSFGNVFSICYQTY